MLKDEIELGLRIIALEELLRKVFPHINHDKQRVRERNTFVWKCKPDCSKCHIAIALHIEQ